MAVVPAYGRRHRWPLILGVAAAIAAAAIYVSALAFASRPGTQARLRQRLAAMLRSRVGEVSIGDRVKVDALLRVSFGPVIVPAARGRADPVIGIEIVSVRPSLWALLRGSIEPASVEMRGVRVAPGPAGRDLREVLARATARSGASAGHGDESPAPPVPDLKLRRLVVAIPSGTGAVELGPFDADASISSAPGETRLLAEVLLGSGNGRIEIDARRSPGGWHARVRARDVNPEIVPSPLRSGAAYVAGALARVDADCDAPADLSRATARVQLALERLVLAGERVGAQPVGPLSAVAEGTLSWEREAGRVALADASAVVLGALRFSARGEASLGPEEPFTLTLRADGVSSRAIVAALPSAIAPPPGAPRPSGPLDARLHLSGPLLTPSRWTFTASLDLSRMREAARRAPPDALRSEILHRPEDAGKPIVVGPRNPAFVPVAELPEHVVRAVTASEDAGFFAHQGFDFDELRNALAEGAEAGRLVRGGSTITQQLAKNLYLTPERTLARKVREAVITIALEASLPKRRILELYLNVAEWGPGIFGIGPAARHWFGKDARELTPREAAFLASIIPNPVRYHFMFARGAPTDAWEQRVNELLLKMTTQGVITDDELVDALDQPIVFAGG